MLSSANTPVPEVQLLSNGRYHVMVTNSGRRKQPLEGPRRHALAGGQHMRQLGKFLLSARRGERRVLVEYLPAYAEESRSYEWSFPRDAPNSGAAITISTRIPRLRFRRKMTSSCAGCASPTVPGRAGRSKSQLCGGSARAAGG